MITNKTPPTLYPLQDAQAVHAIAAAAIFEIEDATERDRIYTQVRADTVRGITIRQHTVIEIAKSLIAAGKYGIDNRATLGSDAVLIADTVLACEAATPYHFPQP